MEKNTVFISYSSKDWEVVNRIVEELEILGVSCWKAPEMIPAGSSYAREIPKAIQNCNVFLLILSSMSQESIWVEKEIDSAICYRKTIIPVQIEELELNDTFRFYLNNVQMVTFYQNEEKAFATLKKELVSEDLVSSKEREEEEKVVIEKVEFKESLEESDPRKRILKITPEAKSENGKHARNHTNALRMNRIPLACQYCGCKELEYIKMGTYQCVRCSKENYDDFQTIRNFLDKVGAKSALVIERETGVPRRIIDYFFKEEYLEIPSSSPDRVPCQNCGAPIRTGRLCEACKTNSKRIINNRRELWHSFRERKIGD